MERETVMWLACYSDTAAGCPRRYACPRTREGVYLPRRLQQRTDPRLGRRMRAEERHETAARERLHDEHVRSGRIRVERDALRHRFNLPERVGEPGGVPGNV